MTFTHTPSTELVFKDAKGATVAEPAGYISRMTLVVDGDAIENPVYETHKRGSNWAALVTGKNAASMHRAFLPHREKIVDISALQVGAVIEIAGDYTSSGGNKSPRRVPAVVVSLSDEELVLDVYTTIAKAISAGNKGFVSIAKEPIDPAMPPAIRRAAQALADAALTGQSDLVYAAIDGIIEAAEAADFTVQSVIGASRLMQGAS